MLRSLVPGASAVANTKVIHVTSIQCAQHAEIKPRLRQD